MTLTEAQKEAYARVKNSVVQLWAIELRHSVFPGGEVRVVQHDEDIDLTLEATAPVDASTSVTFTALGFRFTPPTKGTEPDPTISIQVDGVPGLIQAPIKLASLTSEAVEATFRHFSYDTATDTPVEILAIYHLQLRQMKNTPVTSTLSFGYINSANQAACNVFYTPESNPGLQ